MQKLARQIKRNGGHVSVLDLTIDSVGGHLKSLNKRLSSQIKALAKAKQRGCASSVFIIEDSISKITTTIKVVETL